MNKLLIVSLLGMSIASAYSQSLHFDLRQYTQEDSVFSFTKRDEWPVGGYVQITRSIRIHPTKQNGKYRLEFTFGRHEHSSNFIDSSKQLKSELFLDDYISKCKLFLNLSGSYLIESTNAQQLAEELKPKYLAFRDENREDVGLMLLLKTMSEESMAQSFLWKLDEIVSAPLGGILYDVDLADGTLHYRRVFFDFIVEGEIKLERTDTGYRAAGKLIDTAGSSYYMDLEWTFDTGKRLVGSIRTMGDGNEDSRITIVTLTRIR